MHEWQQEGGNVAGVLVVINFWIALRLGHPKYYPSAFKLNRKEAILFCCQCPDHWSSCSIAGCPPSETCLYDTVVLRYMERRDCLTAIKIVAEEFQKTNKKMAVIVGLVLHMSWKVLIRTMQFRDDSGCS